MAITVLPPRKTALDYMEPYLQAAFAAMIQRKLQQQQEPYEIQKALISGGYAQPISTELSSLEKGAEAFQQKHPEAPYPIPESIKTKLQQKRTPDFSAGGIPFKFATNVEQQLKRAQLEKTQAEAEQIRELMSGRMFTDEEGFRPKSIDIGAITYERKETPEDIRKELEKEKQKEIIKGVSGEVGGRVALAKESIKNIQDIKKALFPEGTAASFERTIAGLGNIPASAFPLLGAFIPEKAPQWWSQIYGSENIRKAQDFYRKMGAAISGRQLIQTGVAARPEETQRLIRQFAPNFFSNSQAALDGLNELEEFYKTYLKQTDPEERFREKEDIDPLGLR